MQDFVKEEGTPKKTLTGIVLEGGAMRGLFTAGVIDVLMENDITFDAAVGVSAGAVFGCNLKSHQIGRVLRYNTAYCNNWRYCSFRSLALTGDLYGADFCYNRIPYELDPFDLETYRKNPMKFYVVCTDAETGKPVYHICKNGGGEDMDWFRASASMPVFSRPVRIRNYTLLDGGISDSIPLRFMEKIGYGKNVVVLTQPSDYIKEKQDHMSAIRVLLRKYPHIVSDLAGRHRRYNHQTAYVKHQAAAGTAFVIQPDEPLNIGQTEHDPEELRRVYMTGRRAATKRLDDLRAFMSGNELGSEPDKTASDET